MIRHNLYFREAVLELAASRYRLEPDRSNSFDELYVDFRSEEVNGGRRWLVFLHPKQDIVLRNLELRFDMPMPPDTRFFANGYQSASESASYYLDDVIPRLRWPVRNRFGMTGDDHIADIPRGRGKFHSWTYALFHKPASTVLAGSLNERTGFTLFGYDGKTGVLTVKIDLNVLALSHSFPALDFWIAESTELDVFDGWFKTMEVSRPASPGALGLASGVRNAQAIETQLEGAINTGFPFERYLIESGWQSVTGDWLAPSAGFSAGMAAAAASIRKYSLSPGLGFSPFVVSDRSEQYRRNPDWLLKNGKGKPVAVGRDTTGLLFALDPYHQGVRDYLSGVFHTALDRWGFDWLKLDRLYAACLAPPPGKTRGAVMWETLEFVKGLTGNRKLLVSDVPVGACIGQVDYWQVCGNEAPVWENGWLKWLRWRERPALAPALKNALERRLLAGRVFGVQPGMLTLSTDRQGLNAEQQYTGLVVQTLLGDLLLLRGEVMQYSPEIYSELAAVLDWHNSDITDISMPFADVFRIAFISHNISYLAYCNLSGRKVRINTEIELLPFETMVFRS